MENRVFGCPQFSNVVFDKSLGMLEKIFDHILDDQYVQEEAEKMVAGDDTKQKVFRVGFYANEYARQLDVMVEIFDDDVLYQARYADQFRPDYMKDPIDFYLVNKIVPKVIKYQVGIYPVLNGVFIDYSPVLYEAGDHLDIRYSIQRHGPVDFNTYMRFLHEAYKSEKLNLENDFAGSWSFMV